MMIPPQTCYFLSHILLFYFLGFPHGLAGKEFIGFIPYRVLIWYFRRKENKGWLTANFKCKTWNFAYILDYNCIMKQKWYFPKENKWEFKSNNHNGKLLLYHVSTCSSKSYFRSFFSIHETKILNNYEKT